VTSVFVKVQVETFRLFKFRKTWPNPN